MKLWYSSTSPFARKVYATILHHHLEEQVDIQKVQVAFDKNSPHNQDNPLGRIPAFQASNGEWLYGSDLISQYLDELGQETPLFPNGIEKWHILNILSVAEGILENTMPMVAEKIFHEKDHWWKDRHQQIEERNVRSLALLEKLATEQGLSLNIATIQVVALVDWWNLREEVIGFSLKENFPELQDWTQKMNATFDVLQASWDF